LPIYYVDGRFLPAEAAVIPADDLAILRGYGVFDFLRTHGGKPFLLTEHIERLEKSARRIGLVLPWSRNELIDIVMQTLQHNNFAEANIRIVVTGGSSPDFITPQGRPRLLVLVTAMPELPAWWYTRGVKIITLNSKRSIPDAKSIDYIPATIALAEAGRQKAVEAVYVDHNGFVLEGTTTNIFIFDGQNLLTPGREVLSGITRQVVLKLAGDLFAVKIEDINRHRLLAADEVFLTGTNKGLVPVIQVDDTVIGDGRPGPGTRKLMAAMHRMLCENS